MKRHFYIDSPTFDFSDFNITSDEQDEVIEYVESHEFIIHEEEWGGPDGYQDDETLMQLIEENTGFYPLSFKYQPVENNVEGGEWFEYKCN